MTTAPLPDKRVVACNTGRATSAVRKGAHAFLKYSTGDDRVCILARSRGGRYVEAWGLKVELAPFRAQTIPAENPLYQMVYDYGDQAESTAERLNTDAERRRRLP